MTPPDKSGALPLGAQRGSVAPHCWFDNRVCLTHSTASVSTIVAYAGVGGIYATQNGLISKLKNALSCFLAFFSMIVRHRLISLEPSRKAPNAGPSRRIAGSMIAFALTHGTAFAMRHNRTHSSSSIGRANLSCALVWDCRLRSAPCLPTFTLNFHRLHVFPVRAVSC
jgi:hypothetical protein